MNTLQRPAVALIRSSGRVILDMYMGTGKTFTALTGMYCFKPQRVLILCSKNALVTWQQEIKKWFPEYYDPKYFIRVGGQGTNKVERERQWKTDAIYFITTSATFIRDIEYLEAERISFDVIIVDEAHKVGIKNPKTKGFDAVKRVVHRKKYKLLVSNRTLKWWSEKVKCFIQLSGTLAGKGRQQMWGYLHLAAPGLFSSQWKFINTFCLVIDGAFGKEIVGPKNDEGFYEATKPYYYRIPEDIAKQHLPPLQRQPLWCELPPKLQQWYDKLEAEMWAELPEGELVTVSTVLAKQVKLRKFLACPALIHPSYGPGNTIEAIWDKIVDQEGEHPRWRHNIIFSAFKDAIPHYVDYLAAECGVHRGHIITMQGGMEPKEVQEVEERFRRDPQTMVISTVQFAQSFNLESGFNAYFTSFSWDQDENMQAESRIRRTTSEMRLINACYCVHQGLADEDQFDRLAEKYDMHRLSVKHIEEMRRKFYARMEAKNG